MPKVDKSGLQFIFFESIYGFVIRCNMFLCACFDEFVNKIDNRAQGTPSSAIMAARAAAVAVAAAFAPVWTSRLAFQIWSRSTSKLWKFDFEFPN